MDQKTIIKIVVIAGVAGVAYWWLNKSGTWALWFSGNAFNDPQKLLAYCKANPTGTAIYIDAQGVQHAAPCAQWIAENATPVQTQVAAPENNSGSVGGVDPTLQAKLAQAAMNNPTLGQDSANVDQWNYLLNTLDPQAHVTDLSEQGIVRGQNDTMTSAQYLNLRAKAGLGSIAPAAESYPNPYAWVN